MYSLLRPALFALDAEDAHDVTLATLARLSVPAHRLYARRVPAAPVTLMGLRLANPVGLAAGLDKNGRCIDGMAALGFGFVEIGTVTPLAQPGNPKPRLFRLAGERALLNRFGFNNHGVEKLVANVQAARFSGVLGINIGKNKDTPPARAVDDYLAGLRAVHGVASYVTINISSPNTQGLRDMQARDALHDLLGALVNLRNELDAASRRRVPLAVKIAPDLDEAGMDAIAHGLIHHRIDGLIATNTTVSRNGLAPRWQNEPGGVSGRPLRESANRIIAGMRTRLGPEMPIIGVGGVMSGADARAKIQAGANAIQLYSGLVYRGPALVAECVRAIAAG